MITYAEFRQALEDWEEVLVYKLQFPEEDSSGDTAEVEGRFQQEDTNLWYARFASISISQTDFDDVLRQSNIMVYPTSLNVTFSNGYKGGCP